MTDDMLAFCRDHHVELSTSLDGRSTFTTRTAQPTRDSFERTLEGITKARTICGHESVAALATVTRHSLSFPREIIDTYTELGFDSIALRPISPFGFAVKTRRKLGCTTEEYLRFYRKP